MLARLTLLFVLVPLIELVLLVQLGRVVGLLPTIALVVATGLFGAALARAEGLRTLAAVQRQLAAGHVPGTAMLDGLCILVGGAFLLTPGLLTDVAGLSLLLPLSRRWFQRRLRRSLETHMRSADVKMAFLSPEQFQKAWGADRGGSGGGLDPRHEIRQGDKPATKGP